MELDKLKEAWNTTPYNTTLNNHAIMQMIQHTGSGPVASLKKAFRKQYHLIIVVAFFVLMQLTQGFSSINIIMFTFYVVFCLSIAYFFYSNYRIVSQIGKMDQQMKVAIQQQINMLETRLRWHLVGIRIALIIFITLLEVLPLFQHARMIDKWHSLPVYIRVLAYAALMLLQYIASRRLSRQKYGQYLAHLKDLATQLQSEHF